MEKRENSGGSPTETAVKELLSRWKEGCFCASYSSVSFKIIWISALWPLLQHGEFSYLCPNSAAVGCLPPVPSHGSQWPPLLHREEEERNNPRGAARSGAGLPLHWGTSEPSSWETGAQARRGRNVELQTSLWEQGDSRARAQKAPWPSSTLITFYAFRLHL